jgi:predicted 3-demethylubiquinone-9 3-methyltransferase (glyoxalase superfamily)
MQKMTTQLMFEGRAEEAMTLYLSLFGDSELVRISRSGPGEAGPEGSVIQAMIRLAGQELRFTDSYVRHGFTFTAATSLFALCETEAELDRLFGVLAQGGQVFMPLADYGFSDKFGWVADRFGVSWQLNFAAIAGA